MHVEIAISHPLLLKEKVPHLSLLLWWKQETSQSLNHQYTSVHGTNWRGIMTDWKNPYQSILRNNSCRGIKWIKACVLMDTLDKPLMIKFEEYTLDAGYLMENLNPSDSLLLIRVITLCHLDFKDWYILITCTCLPKVAMYICTPVA